MDRLSRYQKNQDVPFNETRGKTLGNRSLRQVNLPEINATPNINNVQSSFKRSDLEIQVGLRKSQNLKQNIKSTKWRSKYQQDLTQSQYYSKQEELLPVINKSPRNKEMVNDYISLGARIQDSQMLYNKSAKSGNYNVIQNKSVSFQPNKDMQIIDQGISTSVQKGQYIVNNQIGQTPNNITFENYMKKVIKSVERRKKQSLISNKTQRLSSLVDFDYSFSQNQPQLNTTTYFNLANQINNNNQSFQIKTPSLSQKYKGEIEKIKSEQDIINSQLEIIRGKQVSDLKKIDEKDDNNLEKSKAHPYQLAIYENDKKVEQKASEQVAYLLKETQKKDKIFIPLEKNEDPNSELMFKEMKNAPSNHAGVVVFSKNGFVKVGKDKNATSEFISNQQFIEDGVNNFILKDLPLFKKFQSMRFFKQWKYTTRWNAYNRKRAQLANNWFFAKPIFSEKYSNIIKKVNQIRTLPLIEIKPNIVYGEKQQTTLEDVCQKTLEQSKQDLIDIIESLKEGLQELKKEIKEDDKNFDHKIKENRVLQMIKNNKRGDELIMFSRERKQLEIEEEQYRILEIRHKMYDRLLQMLILFCCQNFAEVLIINKKQFKDIFTNSKNGPQFEISIWFNQKDQLDADPSIEELQNSFVQIFENMEKSIYNNQCLTEFIHFIDSLFFYPKNIYPKVLCKNSQIFICDLVKQIKQIVSENKEYQQSQKEIQEVMNRDSERCKDYLDLFKTLQEIQDFSQQWEANRNNKQISLEMGFYKETWLLMDKFSQMIEQIPKSNTKLGTILVETLSLKKYLVEIPKKIIDSIRSNVTLTMENETKFLREELSKASEILDQLPTSLNVYVEQVNTIKYVKEKQEDFNQKFQTINKLHQLCKQDNIKVNLNLQLAIEEVSYLYQNQPKLIKSASEGLQQNKETMERIMQSSSLVLSKKIKAFERKYIETYLQDKSRLDDCADTLEEIFKRSKAIQEIRSKVILYKEFLKLLFEDDPDGEKKIKENKLPCSDDYESVAQLHKETIKFWKILLYWKKRRQMCYNMPFLQLDLTKIIRSITKVNKYLEDNLMKNEFIRDKSRSITKVVIQQVKEASMIIEFLKDLKKESLQHRHWIEIFNVIKAPHLKNTNTFTIIDLREYHIQNYRDEISQILNHANTELKYEMIFKQIKSQWEQYELKIIPYKETLDAYILINTETLNNVIEENLSTLETIAQSSFAMHLKQDIQDQIKTLKVMLKNLEIWVCAQKNWINLEPLFQSSQFDDILGSQKSSEFEDLRTQYKRIMWSVYKNSKAQYNLLINSRIKIFETLIGHFDKIQVKVSQYLDERRLSFPRFFFLNDSQFLDFLTLANSNQDFNDYINVIFQGAQKLYINKIVDSQMNDKKINELEDILNQGYKAIKQEKNIMQGNNLNVGDFQAQKIQPLASPYIKEARNNNMRQSIQKISLLEQDNQIATISKDSISDEEQNNNNEEEILYFQQKANELSCYQIMGMINSNRELFLFEKPVEIKQGIEVWLRNVEISMQETIAKMISYAISSFPKQPLEEWILDYPQQVILTSMYLVLSHEINDLLEQMTNPKKQDDDDDDEDSDDQSDMTGKSRFKLQNFSSHGYKTYSKGSSKRLNNTNEDEEDQAIKDFLRKKNEMIAKQKAEEEEERNRLQEEIRLKIEANEIPKDPIKEKRKLINQILGKDFALDHKILQEQENLQRLMSSDTFSQDKDKKEDFKENLQQIMQQKSFQGLFLRLQYWINQISKNIYNKGQRKFDDQVIQLELHCVQKMVMKSFVIFLLHQRDIVDQFIQKQVTNINDFEWQSKIKLTWTGQEQNCKVECGGWSTYQQNEYLGSQPRLPLTPLTNKYFVFIASALREKSAVLFKCTNSHQYVSDVFEEFSNICSVPYKKIQCNQIVQMKLLLQQLNGSALAQVWLFFEHLDKLPFLYLQTLNKEIQVLQQQFILEELSQYNEVKEKIILKEKLNKHDATPKGHLQIQRNQSPTPKSPFQQHQNKTPKIGKINENNNDKQQYFRQQQKQCLGIFASISNEFQIQHTQEAERVTKHMQSAFRILSLTTPNESQVLKMIMKSENFQNYECLSDQITIFLSQFYQQRNTLFTKNEQYKQALGIKDLKVLIKLASLLRNKDHEFYMRTVLFDQKKKAKKILMSQQKTRDEKIEDAQEQERQEQIIDKEIENIEINSIKQALHLFFKQKFLNEWARQLNSKDHFEIQKSLDKVIFDTMQSAFSIEKQKEESDQIIDGISNNQIKDAINKYQIDQTPDYKQFLHNIEKELEEKGFNEIITKTLKNVITEMKLDQVSKQIKQCQTVIEYLRKFKGIVIVGPVCTGKTSIFQIVSNVLHIAFQINMRTSVINPINHSYQELYGKVEVLDQDNQKQDDSKKSFSKQSIFQLIIDTYQKEQLDVPNHQQKLLLQSIYFDSTIIDSALTESLIPFLTKANKRERENCNVAEYLLQLDGKQVIDNDMIEHYSIQMPNNNVIMFPSNLYLFFEVQSLKNSSPSFISQVGLVLTQEEDISWQNIFKKQSQMLLVNHQSFFEKFKIQANVHINECYKEFIEPFILSLSKNSRIQQWHHFNLKSSIIQFFNFFNAMIYKLISEANLKETEDELNDFLLEECQRDVIWSTILCCIIWSFGSNLNRDLRTIFEEQLSNYRRKFNISLAIAGSTTISQQRLKFTMFDIYFEPEKLKWDLLSEKLDYKLKLHYDAFSNNLYIPTIDISQAYFMMDTLLSSMKYDQTLNKHFRLLGCQGTSKSTILQTYIQKTTETYTSVIVPMSSYLTINKLKTSFEQHYIQKKRNLLELKNPQQKLVFVIDDLNLQVNLKTDYLEFFRTWCMTKGYFDINNGIFKSVGDFGIIMAQTSENYRNKGQEDNRQLLDSRFLFNVNTLYLDEFEPERYKSFIQHWLTSKLWNTSKLINKYYILITNHVMSFFEKMKRNDAFNNSSFMKLISFHLIAKFCSNLVNYTFISDDPSEVVLKGMREEDAISDMISYELQRTISDRIMLPNNRISCLSKISECSKSEFMCGNHMNPQYLDSILLGNYHERKPNAYVKYLNVTENQKLIREILHEKIRSCSNNHILESFLDSPNSLKEIFRISRILYKEMQHLILIGPPGCGKSEYLQLACILNNGIILELNVDKYGRPLQFEKCFKNAIISSLKLNQKTYLTINDCQIKDSTYIDFVYHFLKNLCNQETCILYDQMFKKQLIDIELEIYTKEHKDIQPNYIQLFQKAIKKIQQNVHIVLIINELSSYYEWISLFPGLETQCEVLYMDELSNEGYRQWTSEIFQQRDVDSQIIQDQKLSKALVEAKQIVKNNVLDVFYSKKMLQYTVKEDFLNGQFGEFVFSLESKMYQFMYDKGQFEIRDDNLKQTNYNVPVEIQYLGKSRFAMFIELFRFFYDYLSLNLTIRKNYYETFLKKAAEFGEFFKDIKSTKKDLHQQSSSMAYQIKTSQDQIEKIQQLITDKGQNIGRKQKDIIELEKQLANSQKELKSVISEKDGIIDDILNHIEKINGTDFTYIIQNKHYQDQEQALLNILIVIIDKDARRTIYSKNEFDMYFQNREELIHILDSCRNYDYNEACFLKIKAYINEYNVNDYNDKALFKQLYHYIMELYRKLNVKSTMAGTYQKIKDVKDTIDSNKFSISYIEQFIKDKNDEIGFIKSQYKSLIEQEQQLSKKIEEAELSHMRTEHIYDQIELYAYKIHTKLTDLQSRFNTLQGDCIILALSVAYLGIFSLRERMNIRKDVVDYIQSVQNINCSSCWTEVDNLQKHNKLFKQILKEYGIRKAILQHQLSQNLTRPIFIETLFTLIFSPSCPYIVDPTGEVQKYIFDTLLTNLKVKKLYASDLNISSIIDQILQSSTFAVLNDLNNCSKQHYGLSKEDAILQRLALNIHNGYDFDYERQQQLKQLQTLESFFNSFNGINKRIPTNLPQFENLSLYQIQIFSPRFEFTLNHEYLSKMSIITAMDSDIDVINGQTNAWVEIKQLMIKYFLPEDYSRLQSLIEQIKNYDMKFSELKKSFENVFLTANQKTLQNVSEYSDLKHSILSIKHCIDQRKSLRQQYQEIINSYTLLSSYSNILSLMFLSLQKLNKVTGEITYSWRMYLNIVEQILENQVRILNSKEELERSNTQESKESLSVYEQEKNIQDNTQIKEFNIDEEFFGNLVIPTLYKTLISGLKQHLTPLYNLILSINIGLKKQDISECEYEFFLKQFFSLNSFQSWRNIDNDFVNLNDKIEKNKFYSLKKDILKVYPENSRKLIEIVEKDLGQNYIYKQASLLFNGQIFQLHKDFKNLTLMQKINFSFLCPDHEFKSKLCQFIYEQLSSLFQFKEEHIRIDQFIKIAPWGYPIALFSSNQINIANTIFCLASYNNVPLELIKQDIINNYDNDNWKSQQNFLNKQVSQNLIDQTNLAYQQNDDSYGRVENEITIKDNITKIEENYIASKLCWKEKMIKDQINEEQISINESKNFDPLEIIEKCAINGSWVLISTLKFPSYWQKVSSLLNKLRSAQMISLNFKLFLDLQGFIQNEIPDSFLFDHSLSFYMTEKNKEILSEQFDIWNKILNANILEELFSNKKAINQIISVIEQDKQIGQKQISENLNFNQDHKFLLKEYLKHSKEEEYKNNVIIQQLIEQEYNQNKPLAEHSQTDYQDKNFNQSLKEKVLYEENTFRLANEYDNAIKIGFPQSELKMEGPQIEEQNL